MSDEPKDTEAEPNEQEAVGDMVAEGAPVPEAEADAAPADDADAPTDEAQTEETVAEAAPEAAAETDAEPAAGAVHDEPEAAAEPAHGETDEEIEEVVDAVMAFEEVEVPASVSEAFGPVRIARVFVCEKGHRTTTLWGSPEICQAKPLRSAPVCGMPLYHITELPEQVQKALNPLKASKKASKKK